MEEERVPAKNARGGTVEGQKKRRVTRKECKRLREELEVRGFKAQKGLWNIAKKRCWKTEEPCPEKTETCSVNTKPCMHEENFLSSWLREDVECEVEERERMDKEATVEESKSGKREVEGERERVETSSKRICMNRLPSKVFEVLCPVSEVESVGNFFDFSVCVPFVTVPLSNVNLVCDVVFSDSDGEWLSRRPFSLSLYRKREASVASESETETTTEVKKT